MSDIVIGPLRLFAGTELPEPDPNATPRVPPVGSAPDYVPRELVEMTIAAGPRRFWCSGCSLRHDAQDAAFRDAGSHERSTAPVREVRASGDICAQCAFEARMARGEPGR